MIHKQILFLLLFAVPSIAMQPEPSLHPCDRYDFDHFLNLPNLAALLDFE